MKQSRVMEERIRRVKVLFKELGFKLLEDEYTSETYMAEFEDDEEFHGSFFIDRDNKFLEVSYIFSFSTDMLDFIKSKLEDLLKICYEFGCYLNIQKNEDELFLSVYFKEYYAGLNYYSLRDGLRDFNRCIELLEELFSI